MSVNFILIDDCSVESFFHQKSIEKAVKQSEVLAFFRARKALDYLGGLGGADKPENFFIPHVILVDLKMPEMDGIGFLKAFQKLNNPHLRDTRVYLMSSYYTPKERAAVRCQEACSGFFRKPLSREDILQMAYPHYAAPIRLRKPST